MKLTALWAAVPMAVAALSTASAQTCGYQGTCGPTYGYGYAPTCEESYYQNSIWPQQYINPSRRGICQAFETMTSNGWRRHNLLGKHHFDAEDAQLTESGRLKTEWILTQAPPSRRGIYVQRTTDQEQTARRIAAVQEYSATLANATPAQIHETHISDEGHSAAKLDAIFTGFHAGQRAPSLPIDSTVSSSGQ